MVKLGFDKNGRPTDVEAAKKEINRIRGDRGYIDDHDERQIRKTDEDFQENYRRRAMMHREVYARYTKTVAEQLYSSDFRLVYELLQNGDDARYPEDVEPSITFRLRPTEMMIESNEQGFSLHDVESICDTGKSSKSGSRSTTGEKGLGFKSVFGIADHVHIQSGLWSFRFEHKKGEDGVGMITPIWTTVNSSLPANTGTRLTLRYSKRGNRFYKRLVSEFEEIPATVIFALRRIKRLTIVVNNSDGDTNQIIFTKEGTLSSEEMWINTLVTGRFGHHKSQKTWLKVFTKTVKYIPLDDQSTATASDITIAFEVDSEGVPVIPSRGHHIFAYLPIRRVTDLHFLVNANFVLTANREAIPDTEWNETLRRGIISAFTSFVRKLIKAGDKLEFLWMRYLPDNPLQGFWQDISPELDSALSELLCLRSMRGQLRSLSAIKFLPRWFLHQGKPLLLDTDEDIYPSKRYLQSDLAQLRKFGLRMISYRLVLERLKQSLFKKAKRHIHAIPLDDSWHTALTNLLERLLQDDNVAPEINPLNLVPLRDQSWTSISSLDWDDPIYFPHLVDEGSVSIEVPEGLGLRAIHPMAIADGERARFYTSLGVSTCPPKNAAKKILAAHKSRERTGTTTTFMKDLEILFWFGLPKSQSFSYHTDLLLVNDQNIWQRGDTLFFPSEDEFDAEKLLSATPKKDMAPYGILHATYMQSQVRKYIRHDLDWFDWLKRCGVSYFPPLMKIGSSQMRLHPLMLLIARDNSKDFVANLHQHLPSYTRRNISALSATLRIVSVPCQYGNKRKICDTILPTQQLMDQSDELNLGGARLPFLRLSSVFDPKQPEGWFFLKKLGVTCELDGEFYLKCLLRLKSCRDSQLISTCTKIYAGIAQNTAIGDAASWKKQFANEALIRTLIRAPTLGEAWCKVSDCLWQGPKFLQSKQVLYPTYGADPGAASFFNVFLGLPNVQYLDLIAELKIRAENSGEISSSMGIEVHEMYKLLAGMIQSERVMIVVREAFIAHSLIFVDRRWLKPSECLWNWTVKVSNLFPLEQAYPGLRNFFVEGMKVMTMNINTLAVNLARTTKTPYRSVKEVKAIILVLGRLLAADLNTKVEASVLKRLKLAKFLPVRRLNFTALRSLDFPFFINDHKRYADKFKNRIGLVDFTVEESTLLHPFFAMLGITHRYLSNQISSTTTIMQSTPSETLRRHMVDRAYALSCCANTFTSPKYYNKDTSLHKMLLEVEVFVCEEMWTELTVRRKDEDVSVRSDRAVVKVSQDDGKLVIYVPSDRDGLYSCFHTELPDVILTFLGIEDRAALKVIYRILNGAQSELVTIMKDEDLNDYSWLEKPAPLEPSVPFSPEAGVESPMADLTWEPFRVFPKTQVTSPHSRRSSSSQTQFVYNSADLREFETVPDAVWERVAQTSQYQKLLLEVVRQAKRGRVFTSDLLSLDEIDQALNELDTNVDYAAFHRVLSGTAKGNFQENARIGAAGELFVFELFKAAGVTDFSLDNWQSSIRHYVKELPAYQDVPPWQGREISDIMYEGNCPRLVSILRQNTKSALPAWYRTGTPQGAVKYHIEVKTTSGPCNTPFFMSPRQYNLMREKACDPHSMTAPEEVFVIMRVFNLFSANIGLQVFIDPWHLRQSALKFVADPWKVIPSENRPLAS